MKIFLLSFARSNVGHMSGGGKIMVDILPRPRPNMKHHTHVHSRERPRNRHLILFMVEDSLLRTHGSRDGNGRAMRVQVQERVQERMQMQVQVQERVQVQVQARHMSLRRTTRFMVPLVRQADMDSWEIGWFLPHKYYHLYYHLMHPGPYHAICCHRRGFILY